ncbi:phosphoribosylaminoimidazole carboxylase [Polaribacter haliotis]|uniref:Phosphoribosylaminoimidazole carboxylase n=1 Tax=Polaribacter haliotis TaxID=1888915 RepID=A0A7L8AE31_9FLAO|nr:phosphoribosylaminoimidazole carboxylase [Polaribacter haliotis]QOD60241.1 phosphoribosylaminoimidazole carboxylase [Polaribacter haliotis]
MFKKIVFFISFLSLWSCSNNTPLENCLLNFPVNVTTDLNNPQLINAQTPGGFAELSGGAKGILLFNINGNTFVAYDRICPNTDCSTPMSFERGLVLKCSCDNSEYSVHFGGAPQTDGSPCPAREYRVTKNGSVIRISNF